MGGGGYTDALFLITDALFLITPVEALVSLLSLELLLLLTTELMLKLDLGCSNFRISLGVPCAYFKE